MIFFLVYNVIKVRDLILPETLLKEKKMKTLLDYSTNAACPQRPVWQITLVGYKWAQSVFLDRNPHCVCGVKKESKSHQCRRIFERRIAYFFRRCQITQIGEPICNM
jgi:hypothetical protein